MLNQSFMLHFSPTDFKEFTKADKNKHCFRNQDNKWKKQLSFRNPVGDLVQSANLWVSSQDLLSLFSWLIVTSKTKQHFTELTALEEIILQLQLGMDVCSV